MEEADESGLLLERVAALDLGKAALDACEQVPHETQNRTAISGQGVGRGPAASGDGLSNR